MKMILMSLCVLAMVSCASTERAASSTQPAAKCLVCEKNADLACVDITVDATTPRYGYNGKTYYFCSDECRAKFAKNPQKYAGN